MCKSWSPHRFSCQAGVHIPAFYLCIQVTIHSTSSLLSFESLAGNAVLALSGTLGGLQKSSKRHRSWAKLFLIVATGRSHSRRACSSVLVGNIETLFANMHILTVKPKTSPLPNAVYPFPHLSRLGNSWKTEKRHLFICVYVSGAGARHMSQAMVIPSFVSSTLCPVRWHMKFAWH